MKRLVFLPFVLLTLAASQPTGLVFYIFKIKMQEGTPVVSLHSTKTAEGEWREVHGNDPAIASQPIECTFRTAEGTNRQVTVQNPLRQVLETVNEDGEFVTITRMLDSAYFMVRVPAATYTDVRFRITGQESVVSEHLLQFEQH